MIRRIRGNRRILLIYGVIVKILLIRVNVIVNMGKFTMKLLLMSLRRLTWARVLRLFVIRQITRELSLILFIPLVLRILRCVAIVVLLLRNVMKRSPYRSISVMLLRI